MNWDCLVVCVNCTLLYLRYVYILFMFVYTMYFLINQDKDKRKNEKKQLKVPYNILVEDNH